MDSWSRVVGIRDLMEKAGLDVHSREDFNRAVAWLRARGIPYESIGRAVGGRKRGILVLAEDVIQAIERVGKKHGA
jgi:predicted alpha/beta hydrolase